MRKINARADSEPCPALAVATVLVLSQHEGVRRQLVVYLDRSPSLRVSGDLFSPEVILQVRPDVVVLDLSQIERGSLRRAIDASRHVGAGLVALASMRDLADERAVTGAGGLYRLKSAGADGLAEIVSQAAARHDSTSMPCRETSGPAPPQGDSRRSGRRQGRTERGLLTGCSKDR